MVRRPSGVSQRLRAVPESVPLRPERRDVREGLSRVLLVLSFARERPVMLPFIAVVVLASALILSGIALLYHD